jgi:putative hydrolase of the HAD superfamily
MIKALLFDFGRVISAQKPKDLFDQYEADLKLVPGTINTTMFDSPLWQMALVGEIGMSDYWQAIGPSLNLHSPEAVQSFQQRYYSDEKINQHVFNILKLLVKFYRLAIVSNHPPGLRMWLQEWAIDHLFEVVFCSGDEGVAKPDSAPFILTLDRMGVSAAEAVFIDDTEQHVAAARSLGLHGMHFTTAEKLQLDLENLGLFENRC